MKLRIVSEGEGKATRIYTPDGEDISRHVRSVDIKITAGGLAIATVEMVNVSIDVSAKSVSRPTKRALDAAIALKNWLVRLSRRASNANR